VNEARTTVARGTGVRRRLLNAAHDLFVEKRYRATTTKEIADRANVAEPTLFRHRAWFARWPV
jgi:AcrR family transcriptional regulator